MNLVKLAQERMWGKGKSKAAQKRRAKREGGVIHAHAPGARYTDSRGRTYEVGKDGAHRRIQL